MKRCNLCILPSSFPNIKFNKDGICNHCLNYKEISYKGKLALKKILESYKNKVQNYNCIIPLSGGEDSAFILYYAVKLLNLKPIAINYDSGFQSKLAKGNINNKKDRFDCLLHSLINHHTLQLLGISSDGYVYSNLVRNGTLRRSEVLLKEKHIEKTGDKECRNIINELDLKDYKIPIIKKSYNRK